MSEAAVRAAGPLRGPVGRRVSEHRAEVLEVLERHGSIARIEAELEAMLGTTVDLVSAKGLKPGVRSRVERDLVAL